ncbi:hypothetical protein D6817_03955 [Candidatus Pacearchaeota archaeon]|nr:MAG: hypothetical protein D6817_03955 [Candidatus Pacearchaeota archaeon]
MQPFPQSRSSQVSAEYLIVSAFVIGLIVIALSTGIYYTSVVKNQVKFDQLDKFATQLTAAAEEVYFQGPPAKTTIRLYLPQGVNSISILSKEIVFNVSSTGGIDAFISYPSKAPLQGTLSTNSGLKTITIQALPDGSAVNITG